MNQQWKDFLHSDGAVLEDGIVSAVSAPSPAPASENPGSLCALTDLGVIRVRGEDACTFLQAHFCNDVASVTQQSPQLSGYCSPKGRLLALFTLALQGEDYLLVLPRELIESVIQRLNMFARMARPVGKQMIAQVTRTAVELSDASDELMVIGFESDSSAELLAGLDTNLLKVLTEPDRPQRYLALATPAVAITVWQRLQPVSVAVTTPQWRLADIRAGRPEVVLATQDAFVPQMTNLHLLQGVSFTKGCYPGQEIVARMQYLGKLKRRMERFAVEAGSVAPGDVLCSADDAAAGTVVQAAPGTEATESELLAVVKISAIEGNQTLHLGTATGPVLRRLSMPYALDAEQAPADTSSAAQSKSS